MNKQRKYRNGNLISRGIEWTDFTWNPVGGCFHNCKWLMPDKTVAVCYARDTANGVASPSYPKGFEYHYWHPERLAEPLRTETPSKIFLDSMSDLMGHWVSAGEVERVLNIVMRGHQHTFQLLTKNPARLPKFEHRFPSNLWVGASSPPDYMWGKRIEQRIQERMLHKALRTLSKIKGCVRWMSFEPLSWDVSWVVERYPLALDWAVIGAATNGRTAYQPAMNHTQRLLDVLDKWKVPVFMKGNLIWEPRREEFPNGEG